jgi:dihydrofolate synthase/folylpolyglutamate synthase
MNLTNWIERIQSLHSLDMDLSLERVKEVTRRLNLANRDSCVITVAGTNGKGSTVAGLETIYLEKGYKVGAFTSPYLFRYNEYVRLQGKEAGDDEFCLAFERIEQARGEISLTAFEFTALAAFDIFSRAHLDIWILEVGLGGRFDAVNVLDADLAIVTSIGIDHVEWLGDTREKIAFEKAGVLRPNQPAVCGDFDPPMSLIQYANDIGAKLYLQQKDFGFEETNLSNPKKRGWSWWNKTKRLDLLPYPKLALQNMSSVLMAIDLLQTTLPVDNNSIYEGLEKVALAGRIQIIPGKVEQIWDVSHNPASAEFLYRWLRENPIKGKTRAVFSMLSDKDILNTLNVIKEKIDEWHIADLHIKRAMSLNDLQDAFITAKITAVSSYPTIHQAHEHALALSNEEDRVIVFGSFHTVSGVSASHY